MSFKAFNSLIERWMLKCLACSCNGLGEGKSHKRETDNDMYAYIRIQRGHGRSEIKQITTTCTVSTGSRITSSPALYPMPKTRTARYKMATCFLTTFKRSISNKLKYISLILFKINCFEYVFYFPHIPFVSTGPVLLLVLGSPLILSIRL